MVKHIKRILMMLMMAFIMIMATQKAYAGFLPNKCFRHNQFGTTMTIGLEDLEADINWNMLCNQHGAPLVGSGANFYVTNTILCRPQEAFILSMMEEGINSYGAPENYRPIQRAWYHIKGQYSGNELSQTAIAYQKFVKKIAKGSVYDRSTFVDAIDDETGLTLKFPQVKDEKDLVSFNVLDESGKLTGESKSNLAGNVKVDTIDETGQLQIGPFSIKYAEGSCNGVDFGAISAFDIYTDASNEPVAKEDWEFRFVDRKSGDEAAYPHADEVFYLLLKPIENATMLTKMDIDYKYLVAGGTYELLDGTFSDELLGDLPQQELALSTFAARWYKTVKIQKGGTYGSLVIKKVALDESGKELTADQVKEKFTEYQYFDFAVKIKYADGKEETINTTARAGESVKVGPITWEGDSAPTYEVIELGSKSGAWKEVKKDNATGSFQKDGTVEITATNQINEKHENTIKIDKRISGVADHDETFKFKILVTYADGKPDEDEVTIVVPKGQLTAEKESKKFEWYGDKAPTYQLEESDTEDSIAYNSYITPSSGTLDGTKAQIVVQANNSKPTEKIGRLTVQKDLVEGQVSDDTFDFRITVDGVSNVEGGKISFDIYDLKAGEKSPSYGFVWEGDKAPTYTVEEINIDSAEEKVSKIEATVVDKDGKVKSVGTQDGNKITGTLVADGEANINAKFTNDMTKHSGGLHVVKEIEVQSANAFPGMTIDQIKEQLFKNGVKFDVEVLIKGTFVYNGKPYKNSSEVIKKSLPDDSGNWAFDVSDITWYGSSAPTFKVTETKITDKDWKLKGVTYTVDGSDLVDKTSREEGFNLIAGKTINATVKNIYSDRKGYIIIHKTPFDENGNDDLTTKDADGNDVTADKIKEMFGSYQYFNFAVDITYQGGKTETLYTTVRAGDSVKLGPIGWKEGETAPTYKVTEIEAEDGAWEKIGIDNETGSLDMAEPVKVTAKNKIKKKFSNKLTIKKDISHVAEKALNFQFKVTVTHADGRQEKPEIVPVQVKAGDTTGTATTTKEYTWYGNEETPSYEIIEEETEDSKKYTPTITPSAGKLDKENEEIIITAHNEENEHVGYLTVKKELAEGQVTDDTFDFKVTVTGEGLVGFKDGEAAAGNTISFTTMGVKAGEAIGPYGFVWKGDKAPTYTVEEVNIKDAEAKVSKIEATVVDKDGDSKSAGTQDGNKISGTLVADGEANINVKFTNDMTKHSGGLRIEKEIETEEKISKETLESDGTKFDIEVVIKGTFVHNGKTYQDTTEVIKKSLPEDGKWGFDVSDITWYGESAPTYTVNEVNLPKGWRLKGITYSDIEDKDDTEGHSLIDGKTVKATVINELPSYMIIDLTFSMSGIVWVDEPLDSKNDDTYYSEPNGVYDEGETLKENTEVTVYKVVYDNSGKEVSREVAKAYKDTSNNEIAFPIVTNSDGKWLVPRINVPTLTADQRGNGYSASYDVEFVYDGQTYEPTEFLSYQIKGDTRTKNTGSNAEKAKTYINAKTSVKDRYARDSMALATGKEDGNVITNIAGETEINASGDSTGIVTLANGKTATVKYHADNAGVEYPVQSGLVTTNEDGLVADIFRATAGTSIGGLTFPFDVDGYDGSTLTYTDRKVTDRGIEKTYKFTAVYNYCLNINLGLKPRETADVALTKTLDNAKVVVKEKMYQYNYSGHFDLTEEKLNSLDKDIVVDNGGETIEYQLGLYRSDYFYRAEMYKIGTDEGIYDRLETFYSKLGKSAKDTEMDIFLTYKIKLSNSSSKYDVRVNSIDDYYDSSFSLVTEDVKKYLQTKTVGGKQEDVNDTVSVATASDYATEWKTTKTGMKGTDKDKDDTPITYNKMTVDNANILLSPGEEKVVQVTFKVNKTFNESDVEDAIVLGLKCNVAEIGSYTTFYAGTDKVAGKIDRDSAPGNVSIITNNSKKWYEDDTMAAPQLNIHLVGEDRTINGVAWEDNSKDMNVENPGYNQQVGDGIKQDDEKVIPDLTTELVERVMVPDVDDAGNITGYTEYNYIWPTETNLSCLGGKTMKALYGLDSTITTDENGAYTFNNAPAGDYVVRFTYGDKKIESAEYSTAKYYNGQDYKSTKLIAETEKDSKTAEGYVRADSYLDIVKTNADDQIKNKAIDSEVRRLQVVEKSRTIDYKNGVVMAEYLDELFKDYYMFADTLKLDIDIEASGYDETKDSEKKYDVNHINCGLEERPITQITLDKQIEEIRLTTSDGRTIMDAKYNITYPEDKITADGKITANVELDPTSSFGTENLQALNRDLATNQGFRYINVDTDILEGTTIMVKYRFTAINTGEVDRTGWLADDDMWKDEGAFKTQYDDLATKLATYKKDGASLVNENVSGHYVGSIYYFGKDGNPADKVVTTKVRQLVDYIDNDMTFDGMMNASANTSWSNVTVAELKEMIKPELVQNVDGKEVIVDENGVSYEATNHSNLVVSVDSDDKSSAVNNGEFVVKLVPNVANADTGIAYLSAMNLTVTKFVGADSDDLQIDNIAEIIKYDNAVGRRDELTVPGNQNPAEALKTRTDIGREPTVSSGMEYERDTSATEVITLSPPTGSSMMVWKMQVALASMVGLIILCGGIILIKKKVLK